MKSGDLVREIRLLKFDQFGDKALNRTAHKSTRISVVVTSPDDSHHIQFTEPVTRGHLSCLLRELADRICRGGINGGF